MRSSWSGKLWNDLRIFLSKAMGYLGSVNNVCVDLGISNRNTKFSSHVNVEFVEGFSEAEIVAFAGRRLSPSGFYPVETILKDLRCLREGDLTASDYLLTKTIWLLQHVADEGAGTLDPSRTHIMGTEEYVSSAVWFKRATDALSKRDQDLVPSGLPLLEKRRFEHSGEIDISIITSVYKGASYIRNFLENIVAQTVFDRCELIFIDANSPDNEAAVIAEYQEVYKNIVYRRESSRIGIYEAWNIGIEMARGHYVTNANLDDMRRVDCLEKQSEALDTHRFVDVVYQNFVYSFDAFLPYDLIEEIGLVSYNHPAVVLHQLVLSNAPHNGPMWRKDLHNEIGLFDTSFKSAGDHDFWMRCAIKGKQFLRIDDPIVSYYVNPEGLSTNPDSAGIREGRALQSRYAPIVTPKHAWMRPDEFRDDIRASGDDADNLPDILVSRLISYGKQKFCECADCN